MSQWLGTSLHAGGWSAFWLAVPPILALSYWIYLQTRPTATRGLRWLLWGLRGGALSLILLMLAELALSLSGKQVLRPAYLALVDLSPSMGIEEDGRRRLDAVAEVVNDVAFRQALAGADVEFWAVGGRPSPLAVDTLGQAAPYGQKTDLSEALRGALEGAEQAANLQGFILFSDGAHNLGEDPVGTAADIGLPVFALGVGQRQNPADIQLIGAGAPEMGYVDRPLVIEARVRQRGYGGRKATVLLQEGNAELARQEVLLEASAEVGVRFEIVPRQAGPHIYRLHILPQEGEFSRDNNEALVFSTVQQQRRRVLLLAGGPGPEAAFLRRVLEADSNAVVTTYMRRDDDRFYGGALTADEVRDADAVVMIDPDIGLLAGPIGDAVSAAVAGGAGLCLIGGPKAYRALAVETPIAEVLPVRPSGEGVAVDEIALGAGPEGRQHPLLRALFEGEEGDPWVLQPPLLSMLPVLARPGAAVLVEGATAAGRWPLVVVGGHGRGRVLAATGSGFWRLDLLSSGVGQGIGAVRRFWKDAVQWLATRAPMGRVRASTGRRVYHSGEDVVFTAQVYDELLRPLSGARVEAVLEGRSETLTMQDRGNGQYEKGWAGLEPGEYSYRVRVADDGGEIGADSGRFIVERYPVEAIDMRADPGLLAAMAEAGGGVYRSLEEWPALTERMSLRPRIVERQSTFKLWGHAWVLGVLVCLLAAEWILRKRAGML